MSETHPQVFGKYLLIRRIAVGGMAEIFLAKVQGAQGFQRDVVIKRILPSYSEDEAFVTMFIDEARIAARLHHPNIVQIYDFDRCDDFYYIAMEFVNGRDLRKVLDRGLKTGKRISPVRTAQVLADIAAGLKHAHEATSDDGKPLNIVHRDVSPHNIMLAFSGEAKILDFGIAKAAARSTRTRAGTVKGKCSYMSPEQARGRPLDGRSDLFALCVIGWEMLAGRKLFQGESDFEILDRVMHQEVPSPSSLNPQVPPELDEILLRGLERDPDRRYPAMALLERDLRNFIFRHARGLDEVAMAPYLQDLFAEELDRGTTVQGAAVAATPDGPAPGRGEAEGGSSASLPSPKPASPAPRVPLETQPVAPAVPPVASAGDSGLRKSDTLPLDEAEIARFLEQQPRKAPRSPVVSEPVRSVKRELGETRSRGKGVWIGVAGVLGLVLLGLGWWLSSGSGSPPSPATPENRPVSSPADLAPMAASDVPSAGLAEESPPAPPSAPPAMARLVLRGLPSRASLLVDGRSAEVGPDGEVSGEWPAASKVRIEVRAEGFAPWVQEVETVAPRTEVAIRLEKALPQARPRVSEKKSPAASVSARATGRVTINVKPWADVFWKGRKIGTTPIRSFEVPAGRQVFVLRNQAGSTELVIEVPEGGDISRFVELR